MFLNFFDPTTTLENIGQSNDDVSPIIYNNNNTSTSLFNNGLSLNFEPSDFQNNDSRHKNESHFEKPESFFAFGDYNEYEDKQNAFHNVVHENPQPNYHKWEKFMSFKPDILETPLYKSKSMISKEYKKETEVKDGNIFDNNEALVLAIRLKSLDEGYQFLSERSNPDRYSVKCFHFKECDWKIRATRWGVTQKYSITFLNDVHTSPKTQTYPNHRNTNKKVIAHLLTPKLQDPKRVIKGKDIQQDLLSEYKINIPYQQAWRGKDYAIHQIKGSPFEFFEMLHAAHLKGQYKGTNLVAVGMDGNNQIVSIDFGICKGETGPCSSWWMSILKECIDDSSNLLFISDTHAVIALAVHNEFPLAFHVVCCRHLMMNLSLKRNKTKGLFWKICKAYTPEEFSTEMSNLQAIQPDAYHKLIEVDPQRWSRAHCPLVRYNYMTSNSVKSVNACNVLYRKLLVLKLAETYRAMVQELGEDAIISPRDSVYRLLPRDPVNRSKLPNGEKKLQGLGVLVSRAIDFLRGTSVVLVILVKGHTFPTIVKV
ncbi:transposase, MuDR, MULE transposase domain protein [Tanacetum coccineum]